MEFPVLPFCAFMEAEPSDSSADAAAELLAAPSSDSDAAATEALALGEGLAASLSPSESDGPSDSHPPAPALSHPPAMATAGQLHGNNNVF